MTGAIAHPIEILFGGGVGLACAGDGSVHADELHGLFAADTRVLSTYRFTIAGQRWRLLARWRPGPSSAQWDLQNGAIRTAGTELAQGAIHGRLRRRVFGALHDDLTVTAFVPRATMVRLALQLDADFADLFEVKDRSTPPRLAVSRHPRSDGFLLDYQHRGFHRGLDVTVRASAGAPHFAGSQLIFDLVLEPGQPWRCCLDAVPVVDGRHLELEGDPHAAEPPPRHAAAVTIDAPPLLAAPFTQARIDLDRLAVPAGDGPPYIAAGAPWFLALFGRDALMTSLMAGLLGPWHMRGALAALGALQARVRDDFRDAEPGKILHEYRHGELARSGAVPHSPYYGAHDAPALYVLALWHAFRWTADPGLLDAHLSTAEAALRWCERDGDLDGDGLLEYRSRSRRGYHNQGWKDAGDAIPDHRGRLADLPVATVELQGYWYAAQLAMAELLAWRGEGVRAAALRASARDLQQRVEDRYWLEDAGCYALALDGRKRPVRSIASNPGHLLWCGLPRPDRAHRLAGRLLADDMFSGFGVRTLSALHPAYDPLSYQCGSVWPHDNALLAAGLARYRLYAAATRVLDAILAAAARFEQHRLPELFCGFPREEAPPVPYESANVPQAWAAAVPILVAQILLGLVADVPAGRCSLSPWLPPWLPRLVLRGIEIGDGHLDVVIRRDGDRARIERADHPRLAIVEADVFAPLWGAAGGPAETRTEREAVSR